MAPPRGILGHVIMNSQPFTQKEENVEDHGQLPQFLPRMSWPSDQDATLTPMPPYQWEVSGYDDCQWASHLAVVEKLFQDGLYRDSGIDAMEMLALLRIVSYGMHKSMTFFHPWVVDAADPTTVSRKHPNRYSEGWDDTFGMMLTSGSFGQDLNSIADCKQRIWTRRWIVVPMMYGASQWGMSIFDRKEGQLYIFDCGEEGARAERIKACTEFWMQFWNRLHLPNTFAYFVPSVSRQPSGRDSGLLCIIWLMNTLRDQVGAVMKSDDEGVETRNYTICRAHPLPDHIVSRLHLRDWVPDESSDMWTALAGVQRIIEVLLCNELGLTNNEALAQEGGCPSAWALLENVIADLQRTGGTLASEKFWTGHGGPQFITANGSVVRGYDPSQPRRHSKPSSLQNETIEIQPHALVSRSAQAINWPSNGVIYTRDFPVHRPPHAEDLAVLNMASASWRDSPLRTSPASVHFVVTFRNRAAPLDFQVINTCLNISVENIKHEWLNNELQNLNFTLAASMGDDCPTYQSVSLCVPHSCPPGTSI